MTKVVLSLFVLFLYSSCFASLPPFLKKYHSLLVLDKDQSRTDDITAWMLEFGQNNRFIDIDYTAVDSNNFEPVQSIYRASIMSRAYFTKGHFYFGNAEVKRIALAATRTWLKLDLKNYNWWNNMIGVQTHLVPTVLGFWDEFSSLEKNKIFEILNRSKLNPPGGGKFTGQNLLWVADFYIIRGYLFNRSEDISIGAKEIQGLLQYSPYADGFQRDGGFFQHKQLMYSAGYGAIFTETMGKYFYLFHGTDFEFSDNHYKFFDSYVLDGQAKLTFGNWIDFQASGRNFTRTGFGPGAIVKGLGHMLKSGTPRISDYQKFYDSIKYDRPLEEAFNHHFFNGDMMVQQRPSYYSSVRMFSKRTLNTDFPSNNEGLLSHNIADGALQFLTNNSEYQNIFGIWNYNLIPGTTADQTPLIPTKFIPGVESGANMVTYGKTDFVGGVSNGVIGVAAMDFIKPLVSYNLTSKKSWIYFNEGVLALGAGITCRNCPGEVVTAIDQTYFNTTGYSDEGNLVAYNGKFAVNMSDKPWKIEKKLADGNWSRVNKLMSDKSWQDEILIISQSHGKKPENASYLYGLAPDRSSAQLLRTWKTINSSQTQVAWNSIRKIYAGSLYGSMIVSMDNISVKNSHPVLFILEDKPDGWKLHVADPTQKLVNVVMTLIVNGKAKSVSLMLPKGLDAGKTLTTTLSI